jgi:hypothetical protein
VWIDVEDAGAPAVGDDALASFASLLESYVGVVGGTRTHGRYNARFTLDAANLSALDALSRGVGLLPPPRVPSWPPRISRRVDRTHDPQRTTPPAHHPQPTPPTSDN